MSRPLPQPRPSQARILAYGGGRMGVAAVPGSGKTWTLSLLAARLVRERPLERGPQILVVTLVNAARGKFEQQVREFLGDESLGTQYRVRTLHGLAVDIVAERPGLVGLTDDFQIIDETESLEIIRDGLQAWFSPRPDFGREYLTEAQRDKDAALRKWRENAVTIAGDFIKRAKDFRVQPATLRDALRDYPRLLPLAEMCTSVYEAYERGLHYRGSVDFQDLIRLALQALEADADFLAELRRRWPIILEDEAQDSSKLQEEILRTLAGEAGNWVRVGDPNQAIYETFTTASPEFLRHFLTEPEVAAQELPESGRSAPSIIALANRLITWSENHPVEPLRERHPLTPPLIAPLATGNPEDRPGNIRVLLERKMTSDEERELIVRELAEWVPKNRQSTVAVLVPNNSSGSEMSQLLRRQAVPFIEILKTTTSTRQVAGTLYRVLNLLAVPTESGALAEAFICWRRDERESPVVQELAAQLRRIQRVEQYVSPRDIDWLRDFALKGVDPERIELLQGYRDHIAVWQQATLLPIDQLVLTVSGDLFTTPAEMATAGSIAIHLQSMKHSAPETELIDYVGELKAIAQNKRKFIGLGEDDNQFDPSRYPGQVVVMTQHGAKGLEWDRVYLTSVNNYDFPSADPFDRYRGEPYYSRDSLNTSAEAMAQLKALISGESYVEGQATIESRVDYAAERLRLLYVGITRARRELIISWNTGRGGDLRPARPLHMLKSAIESAS
ncbi:MAG: ATP-dependent helicase [Acidobacteriota bacterium]